jgi:hypothetical protein
MLSWLKIPNAQNPKLNRHDPKPGEEKKSLGTKDTKDAKVYKYELDRTTSAVPSF